MTLDSVRGLKAALTTQLLPRIETSISARAAFGQAAGPIERAGEPPPSVALGVAPAGGGGFKLAVRVQKRAFEASREVELIVKQAKGEADVRYVGRIAKRATPWHQDRQRPLLIGCSVGHFKITAGTLGCFVKTRAHDVLCMLSNNHVLANENDAKAGDVILQPGKLDGGVKPKDAVAKLRDFVKLKKRGANFVDGAIAAIDQGIRVELAKLRGLVKLTGLGDPISDTGISVAKVGRTTGVTHGKVTAFELDNVVISYDLGKIRFDDQVEIEGVGDGPFSDGGDSGSLIVDADKRGVALLFAGGDQGGANGQGLTYANPLRAVLDALKVNLAL